MTSSKPSEEGAASGAAEASTILSSTADAVCEKCGGPMRLRNARPFPVLLQTIFGVSFAGFLWAQSAGKIPTRGLWIWSAFQVVLGVLLVRARYASAKKVFICLRCGATLR
ncbi:MAG: hypothetical protein JST04_04825 [Bdellovibrionales bacterium]|nr:hypothetical protein [Bdellovibrionales bacterium]